MTYPQSTEYHSAVQSPELCFFDPELRSGVVRSTPLGLPHALSGGFALTYTIQNGSKKFAVRCFHREVPDLQHRYEVISKRLKSLNSKFFVDFDYEDEGIKVNKAKFPIVKMRWVEGLTLGDYISKNLTDKSKLMELRRQFRDLSEFLIRENIAHGDIQDLNVIVSNDRVVLIDYDGMYVDGLPIGSGNEIGHKDYQHPLRTSKEYGPTMDRFSLILIDLALTALIEQPSLLNKYRSGGEAILFKANDFKDPINSPLLNELEKTPALSTASSNFRAVCQAPVTSVPSLGDFLAGTGIPIPSRASAPTPVSRPDPVGYISSYDVLDASSFSAVLAVVGQKVELIGRVVDVKQGVGRRGRGRGRPYVFINFGNWQQDCVKLTIWSEALDRFTSMPNSSLVGQWVSVIGLIDPPYEGSFYGKSYRNVGITIDRESQIERISSKEAAYRLASPKATGATSTQPPNNRDLLKGLSGGKGSTRASPRPQASTRTVPQTAPVSPNKAILATIKNQSNAAPPRSSVASHSNQPQKTPTSNRSSPSSKRDSSSSWIFWVIGGLFLLFMIFGG
ncbi:protein kinase family protein [Ruegeria arenilitoris]|uniref:protein kinase family protein n=1 Tax=Ruegeria arenilitoris TaxID=1173585 RepID=UPI0014809243|nr:protein kinase family protein [Ruegeria arenilitoris]